jgi:hypothetical protein
MDALAPRLDDRRADHTHDVVVRRVVRAARVALGVVHDALEHAAEDVRVDVRPVGLGRLGQRVHLRIAERQRVRFGEQAAVEVRHDARCR